MKTRRYVFTDHPNLYVLFQMVCALVAIPLTFGAIWLAFAFWQVTMVTLLILILLALFNR